MVLGAPGRQPDGRAPFWRSSVWTCPLLDQSVSLWRSAVPSLQRHVMACFPLCLEGLYLFFIKTFRGYKIDDLFEQSETL